ncbi:MAG: hypothetical protein IPJ65_04185 [Archangiaceae bacterium]|nr:hypothetical protein [Archangiaceae bacterium]
MKTPVVLLLLACASEVAPVEPVWGKEPCAHCMMLVSERPPAAQLLLEGGQRKFFDDVGCMLSWVEHERARPKAWWVRVGDGWQGADQARYARAHTPMDFGFVGASQGVSLDEVGAAVRQKASARSEVAP